MIIITLSSFANFFAYLQSPCLFLCYFFALAIAPVFYCSLEIRTSSSWIKNPTKIVFDFSAMCERLASGGISAVVDMAWGGWIKGRKSAADMGVPYIR